jgi:hypothetical protein
MRAIAALGGAPEIRWAIVPHPIARLDAAGLAVRAAEAIEMLVAILTGRADPESPHHSP